MPGVDRFVGREEDICNITGYLDFYHSDVQVVHIVGPPGFGKSTLAKKIGEIIVRKRVNVHYVDLNPVTDIDTLAEKIMLSIFDSISKEVKFYRLEKWARNQYSSTLIILDNCDRLFEHTKEEFLDAIKNLTAVSTKSVRYLLTSQHRITDIGNFRLHPIYNLSTEASIQLLSRVAPVLTHDQMIQIANLTGNVPLALDIVGAIFNYPDPPAVEEVIQGLIDNLVATLSPIEVHSKVDVSIGLAYSYLTPELKQLCVNLSQFPGTFTRESAFNISGHDFEFEYFALQLNMLIQRSLLHYNRAAKRCYFHQLLKTFFNHKSKEKSKKQHFDSAFQLCYALTLDKIVNEYEQHLALAILDEDKHNFHHMFSLFKTSKHVNNTFFGITVAVHALELSILELRFIPIEILNYSLSMLEALDSYTDDEQTSVESFHETYTEVVLLVARRQWLVHKKPCIAIKTLQSKQKRIEEGYKRELLHTNLYKVYYTILANYYRISGNEVKVRTCHEQILKTHGHLEQCSPNCDYFSISIAYDHIEDQSQAFYFRELAYEHQQKSLGRMEFVLLIIYLYNDYSNVRLGNSVEKANNLASIIEGGDVYQYLMTADNSKVSDVVYGPAIGFFKESGYKERAVNLEHKLLDADQVEQCVMSSSIECGDHLINTAVAAQKKQLYYRALKLANASFQIYYDLGLLNVEAQSSFIIGSSLYHIGNYSESQIWLKRALHFVSQDLKSQYSLKIRLLRVNICNYILFCGDAFNMFCYGYIIKHTLTWEYSTTEFKFIKEEPQVSSSTEIQQKNSYNIIWSSEDITRMYMSALANHLLESIFFKMCIMISICIGCLRIMYVSAMFVQVIIRIVLMGCAKKCRGCLYIIRFTNFIILIMMFTMFLFTLGLDWLY